MTTKNIVPRFDGEGGIGTSVKKWGAGYFTTPANGDNSNKAATTEYVQRELDSYLPLSGGTMTGTIQWVDGSHQAKISKGSNNLDIGWSYTDSDGAGLGLRSTDNTDSGEFFLYAKNASNSSTLIGKPSGSLVWAGKEVERVNASGSNYIRYESGLQIYWDVVNNATSTGTTVTFSVPFSASPRAGVIPANGNVTVWTTSLTSTAFKIHTSGNVTVIFVVIGKWK